ncbi:immunoglobulin-like domain-containing receptor 2 isoform X2 [Puntigrus tetrazona]|uniref:immunoglobulin-like domain-containing receptor 2 isoform X2 n=1 Tax=Puntigrus tetrazona TaxID=1606681 RepID=UPI001C8A064F|nr:immunoglobulin-like domain-containing receptor 2 isoform X2 [Puntigrus tetrazona]
MKNTKRKPREKHDRDSAMALRSERFNALSLLRCWISILGFTAVSVCEAVQVSVRDERRFAMLFQAVVLPCHYSSVSSQTPVIQWWYKSYCRDRSRDAFRFPDTLAIHGSELGSSVHLDCGDSGRTVRIVASGQGSSITLAEHYKGRDISIINKADLRIGELQWGDSGVYYCKVVISDDLEGQNEAHVELLVLEWVFVSAVLVGSLLVILLVGVCWCQCCPHSCCCYVRCCCCPDTCCCPRHLYEAGKGIKSVPPTPVSMLPPYYIPGMPTMVPIAPPSLIDPSLSAAPSLETGGSVRSGFHPQPASDQSSLKVLQFVEKQLAQFNPSQTLSSSPNSCSMSELSSLHDVETDFRQTFRQVQKKALPAIPDLDDPADLRATDLSPVHEGRYTRQPPHRNRVADERPSWKPRSEHLQRKTFQDRGRTGSVDELEEFAMEYMQRGRHGDIGNRVDDYRERERERSPFYRPKNSPGRRPPSPPPLPGKNRDTWGNGQAQWDQSGRDRRPDYDPAILNSLLERKANAPKSGASKTGQMEDDSDTPSKSSSKKSSERVQIRTPSKQSPRQRTAEDNESLPPYTEKELERSGGQQPFRYTRSGPEELSRPRKVTFFDEQSTQFDSDLGLSITVRFVPRFDNRK